MLRKIINLIVVFAVIVAISGIFIHLYNNSNKKHNKFDTVKEKVNEKIKSKKKKTDDANSSGEASDKKSDTEDLTDNDVSSNDEEENSEASDSTDNINGNEVAVVSTGTKENIYITLVGGIIVISGTTILLKLNKDRV
ncbi:MAG: hypothetical protein IKF19_01950 [Bacilli bacterium]|nr:hypothetical protein [Bacilli bacterium]